MSPQGVWNERADLGQWEAERAEDLPQDVLLHHAGRHAAATPHGAGSHDGERSCGHSLLQAPLLSVVPNYPHRLRAPSSALPHIPFLPALWAPGLCQPEAE